MRLAAIFPLPWQYALKDPAPAFEPSGKMDRCEVIETFLTREDRLPGSGSQCRYSSVKPSSIFPLRVGPWQWLWFPQAEYALAFQLYIFRVIALPASAGPPGKP